MEMKKRATWEDRSMKDDVNLYTLVIIVALFILSIVLEPLLFSLVILFVGILSLWGFIWCFLSVRWILQGMVK